MNVETIRRIALARHLLELAEGSLRSKNDFHLFAAANLAQDAIETFLIALAANLNVAVDQNTKFDKYFVLINAKIAPSELPFKAAMLQLNRVRVNSKHHGIQPARDECKRLLLSAREFLDEASRANLGASFATISAIDLLEDGESKDFLTSAKHALEASEHGECVVFCRKALFLEIESSYDVSGYRDQKPQGILAAAMSRSPYYARNMAYVAENVLSPTDYIVLDHSAVDRDLLVCGIEPTKFWNVWRLTPDVYRNSGGKWYVKHDFSKLQASDLVEVSEYVFNTTLDIALARQSNRQAIRSIGRRTFDLGLKCRGLSLHVKADRSSPVAARLPVELERIGTDYYEEGLSDDGIYWHVFHLATGSLLHGFLHEDDVREED